MSTCKYCGNTGRQMNDMGEMVPCLHPVSEVTQPVQAVNVVNLSDALRLLEEYAMAGVTLGTDDAARLQATTRALSGEKAGPVDGWHPIETAPKEWGSYLVWSKGYGMNIRDFQLLNGGIDGRLAGHWYDDDDACRDYEITHWMPLPASPTPDKEG